MDDFIVRFHSIVRFDSSIYEVLVNLGKEVLRLSSPQLTRTRQDREALARSVNRFSICASHSTDPRVRKLAEQLEQTIIPRLRLVASR